MRYEIVYGIGFNLRGERIGVVQGTEVTKIILAEAAVRFGGCNLLSGQGAWLNAKGTLVVEESRTVVIDAGKRMDGEIIDFAEFVRRVLEQEAVHVTRIEADSHDVRVNPVPVEARSL